MRNVRARTSTLALLLLLLAGAVSPALAQQLTVERLFGTDEFAVRGIGPIQWIEGGARYTMLRPDSAGVLDLVAEDPVGGTLVLARGATMVRTEGGDPIDIEDYWWSADERRLLLFTNSERVWRQNTLGEYWVYDLDTERLTPVSPEGKQMFAKFSPDGSRVGFVRDNDLWVMDVASGQVTRLTHDGSATIINGTTDWVYEEEFDLRDAWRWSPDGRRIAFWRFDQSAVGEFPLLDYMQLYEEPMELRYPKAGTPNSTVRIGVVDVASGETTWIEPGAGEWEYIARMDWAGSSDELTFQRLPRWQNRIDVMIADARTGESRVLFSDTDSAWVDVDDDMTWIDDGRRFIWSSERDGWNQLYLHDRDGSVVRQITSGDWDVTAFHGVDEEAGWVYFSAAERSPLERHLYRIRLDGTGMRRITREPGTHSVSMAPGGDHFIDVYSTAENPPVTRLHRADGTLVRELRENGQVRRNLASARVRSPEFFTMEAEDGTTLNGWMIKPPNFDASRRWPVLMYVYGGPGSQTVTDGWGGFRYLWHQLLAERGYIVASVDNRGTGARGRDFRKIVYQDLGAWESRDQVAAAQWLGSLPYVDRDRIGIWGWSYGGYMTALAMMKEGAPFRAGISVAPVTDWRLYDTIYTERFMRTPQANPEGYERSAPTAHAARLEGDLLLIHGTGDDNVHYQNAVQLTDALIEAGKQFDLMFYPNRTHSIAGGNTRVHLFTLMTEWLAEHLPAGAAPAT